MTHLTTTFNYTQTAALRWRHDPHSQKGVVRIHGDRDRTFPNALRYADIVIPGAGHMLALTHSSELASAILQRQVQAAQNTLQEQK